MSKPTSDDLELAAIWCENNEGDGCESVIREVVAPWLRAEARKLEEREIIASIASRVGCSVSKARAAWRASRKEAKLAS